MNDLTYYVYFCFPGITYRICVLYLYLWDFIPIFENFEKTFHVPEQQNSFEG